MNFQEFCDLLDEHLYDGLKGELISKIALNPKRFDILLRPTRPRAKVMQFLLQSREIRMGNTLGLIVEYLLAEAGYPKICRIIRDEDGSELELDQYFKVENNFFVIEQKVRDDHDTSARRGIINRFQAKVRILHQMHGQSLVGVLYFIDPGFSKNKSFFAENLSLIQSEYRIDTLLFYGADLFVHLDASEQWNKLLDFLREWKLTIPMLPEVNLDTEPKSSFEELKGMKPTLWKKILIEDMLWEQGIITTIFPSGATLRLLLDHFSGKEEKLYQDIAERLSTRLTTYYSHK